MLIVKYSKLRMAINTNVLLASDETDDDIELLKTNKVVYDFEILLRAAQITIEYGA